MRVLEPANDPQPSYAQFGWSSTDGVKLPGDDTLWTSSGGAVAVEHPVTLSWDNGAGLVFHIVLAVDDNYLFTVHQSVHSTAAAAVQVWPWERVRRDYLPQTAGYSVLFEGLIGVVDNKLEDLGYAKIKSEADKHDGVGYDHTGPGGWAGYTDKYWLTALVPDQALAMKTSWNHWLEDGSRPFPGELSGGRPAERLRPVPTPASTVASSSAPRKCTCWTATRPTATFRC